MRYLPALILDAVLVLVFAVIGRASHDEAPAGFLLTAWPFLVALLVGHALAAVLRGRPRRPWSLAWGAVVWVVTVAGGMLLRVLSGDTAQVAFVIVATIVLGVLLLGWRALAGLLRRRRGGAASPRAHSGSDAGAGAAAVAAEPDVRRGEGDRETVADRDGDGGDGRTDSGDGRGDGGTDSGGWDGGSSSSDSGSADSGGGSSSD